MAGLLSSAPVFCHENNMPWEAPEPWRVSNLKHTWTQLGLEVQPEGGQPRSAKLKLSRRYVSLLSCDTEIFVLICYTAKTD